MAGDATALVRRLFALAGIPEPTAAAMTRLLARCPRPRLVRVVAWYAWEIGRGASDDSHLAEGVRILIRGWDDFFTTLTLPRGAPRAKIEEPARRSAAFVTRPGRAGRGWLKESFSTIGAVRPEIELGTRWLESAVGCIVHDDCIAIPALGIACAMSVTHR